ncbi:MAG: head GIN domain-containing protein [Polyangiaceae bacterium]
MKTTSSLPLVRVTAFLSATVLMGCVTGSGRPETKSFALEGFDAVEINEDVELEITRADTFSVSVTADDNLWDDLEVNVSDGALHVELPWDTFYSGIKVHAKVSMPSLTGVHTRQDARATFSGFESSAKLDLHASGASEIDGDANVEALSLDLSGSSGAVLTGAATKVTVSASGSSDCNLGELDAASVDVKLSGLSDGIVSARESLDYDLSGASHLVYFGDPTIGVSETSGQSSAEHKD